MSKRVDEPPKKSSLPFVAAVTLAAAAAFLWQSGELQLTDPDEGRYAEIAREMLESGDWLIPRLYGVAYLEKPPLLYWLAASSFRLFGTSELAARLVPVVSAAIGVGMTALFASRVFGLRIALLAAVILPSSLLYFALAHGVVTDVPFAAALGVALMAYALVELGHLRRVPGYAVFWLAMALATLAKGPAAVVIAAGTIGAYAIVFTSPRRLFDRVLWAFLPVYLMVAIPWFLFANQAFPDFLYFYLFKEHAARVGGAEHAQPFYWYVPWLLLGFMPWTPRVLVALWRRPAGWRREGDERQAMGFLALWSLVVFALFSVAGGKLGTYILPLFPAIAILAACLVDSASRAGPDGRASPGAEVEALVYLLAAITALAVDLVFPIGLPLGTAVILALCSIISAAIALRWRRAPLPHSIGASLAAIALTLVAVLHTTPAILDGTTATAHIRMLRETIRPEDEIVLYRTHLPSVAFYTRRHPYLAGGSGELRFGARSEPTDRLFPKLEDLRPVVVGSNKRFYCLMWNRRGQLAHVKMVFPEARVIATNLVSAYLLLYDPPRAATPRATDAPAPPGPSAH